MEHNVSRAQMDEILRRYVQATSNGVFTSGDVMMATAEYLGRIIVELADTPVAGMQRGADCHRPPVRNRQGGHVRQGLQHGRELTWPAT